MEIKDWGVVLALCLSAASLYLSLRREREDRQVGLLQRRMRAIKQVTFSRNAMESVRHQMSALANFDERSSSEELYRSVFEKAGDGANKLQEILQQLEAIDVKRTGVHRITLMLEELLGEMDMVLEMSNDVVRDGERILEEVREQKKRI